MRALWVAAALVVGCGCAAPPAEADDPRALQAWLRYRRPEVLLEALALRPGDRVADVGAGTGLFTWRLAKAVAPTGRVIATDIDASALARLERRGAETPALRARVQSRRVTADDPGLEAGAYDLILLSEVDHLLPDRARYLTRLRAALAPHGRIAITNRRLFRDPLWAALRAAGFARAREIDALADHFLLIVENPA